MKRATLYILLVGIIFFVSCRQFEPAKVQMEATMDSFGKVIDCEAVITDDGDAPYFTEQGYCYGSTPTLSHSDVNTTVVTVHTGVEKMNFSWEYKVADKDSVLYLCAYVKNNGGIGYSNTMQFKIK